jgi:hypothetical protein
MAFAAQGMPVTGAFVHKETARPFEFTKVLDVFTVTEKSGKVQLFPHLVYVGPEGKETRMARVLKTVAYVVVDETVDGKLVVEKWPIKKHTVYR